MICVCNVYADDTFSAIGFFDGYLATSQNTPVNESRAYFTQASQNSELQLNLAAAGLNYDNGTVRARVIGQYGDSVDLNYNAEPRDSFKYIQESYLGVSITPETTLDVGTFLAHIGAEGWMSKDNATYTRSFIAEFSPYYETGVRLSHRFSRAVTAQALLLNGWQNTSDGRHPALGTQLRWEKNDYVLTSNTFFGAELGGARYFHDLIAAKTFKGGESLIASIDLGYQAPASAQSGYWWGYTVIGKKPINTEVSVSARIESYQDPGGVIVSIPSGSSFRAHAASLGVDYQLLSGTLLRGEIKHLLSPYSIFPDARGYRNNDTLYVVSLSYALDRHW